MGNWQLEVFKMGMYVAFPVGLFYVFNNPDIYESMMMGKREQMFPPQDPKKVAYMKELTAAHEARAEKRWKAQQEQWEAQQDAETSQETPKTSLRWTLDK